MADDDEVQFLDYVEQRKLDADKQKELEEKSEMNDYREKIASLQEQNLDTVSYDNNCNYEVLTFNVLFLENSAGNCRLKKQKSKFGSQ